MDNNGFISKDELNQLFKAANLPLPGYKIREIVQEFTRTNDQLTFDEFTQVRSKVTERKIPCLYKALCALFKYKNQLHYWYHMVYIYITPLQVNPGIKFFFLF